MDYLVKMAPEIYANYVVMEKGKKVLYTKVLRALYGMLIAALLWYKKLQKDLELIGFWFNAYDLCVANQMKNRKQHTICYHVDDMMSSHMDLEVNDNFYKWLNAKNG